MHLYAFDFDDTLVTTSSRIWTGDSVALTTAQYAALDPAPPLAPDAFREFCGPVPHNCHIQPAAAWDVFTETVRKSQPVAVVTSRAHNLDDFARFFFDRVCLELGCPEASRKLVRLYTVHSQDFQQLMPPTDWDSPTAVRKCLALQHFAAQFSGGTHRVQFHEDDAQVLSHMERVFAEQGRTLYFEGVHVLRPAQASSHQSEKEVVS